MVSQIRTVKKGGVVVENLQNDWKSFAAKDRVQSFIIIMILFTVLYLLGEIPVELFEKVSTMSIIGIFGADAADNITNWKKG